MAQQKRHALKRQPLHTFSDLDFTSLDFTSHQRATRGHTEQPIAWVNGRYVYRSENTFTIVMRSSA